MKIVRYLAAQLVVLWAALTYAGEFYVAPNGSDANPGTKERPFATLARARDAVRESKGKENAPINVFLRGGTYFVEQPVRFGPEDSGTKDCPITYSSYPGEKAVISGGKVIAGWTRASSGVWTAEIPEVKRGKRYFRQLFADGQRRCRARLPQDGCYKVAAPGDPPARAFQFNPGEINPKWRNLDDVEVVLLQFWTEARLRIKSIDPTANMVRFTGDTWRPMNWSKGWYLENVFEGLAKPGSWYLDRQSGLLYYRPLPGENVERVEFVAPATEGWVRLEGDYKTGKLVEYLTFRGLAFQYSSWDFDGRLGYSYPQACIEDARFGVAQSQVRVPAAIYARGARHIRFEDNEMAHTGGWAILLAQGGCQDNVFVGNTMRDLGAGAIRVGGPVATNDSDEESGRTRITDNRIDNCAKVYLGSAAIIILQSSGNRVAQNEITGSCQWGISVGWTWNFTPPGNARNNIIEYNHCHHIRDGTLGVTLYFLGIQPGTVARNNLVHDVTGNGVGNGFGDGCGIGLDESSTGILIENNVVHHVDGLPLGFNFSTIGNIIQNNVFALAGRGMMDRSGDPGKLGQTGVFYRNIFYYNGDKGPLFAPKTWSNYDIVLDCNLYYDVTGKPPRFLDFNFEQWKSKGLDCNSIVANPLFVDPEKGNFRLKPESPAFKLGFRPIDLGSVGIRSRAQRSAED
jgi:hypothetical protein